MYTALTNVGNTDRIFLGLKRLKITGRGGSRDCFLGPEQSLEYLKCSSIVLRISHGRERNGTEYDAGYKALQSFRS